MFKSICPKSTFPNWTGEPLNKYLNVPECRNFFIERNRILNNFTLLGGWIIGLLIFTCILNVYYPVYGKEYPTVNDDDLQVELIVEGLKLPTSMDFVGPDDILVLEKNNGTVRRVVNGTLLPQPLLDMGVATERERGMLGVAEANKTQNSMTQTYVFIYFTESKTSEDGLDHCPPPQPYYCDQDSEPLGNRLYRYELVNNKLVNPKLLLDLPAKPGPNHNGGVVLIGPDKNIYMVIGDLLPYYDEDLGTKAINFRDSQDPDGRGGILRITQNGDAVDGGVIGNADPLDKYYAYGIRNSFGIDFDPITGKLWDTENGPAYGDEINLVEPGFNSGWIQIQGIWAPYNLDTIDTSENILELIPGNSLREPDEDILSDFNGTGVYSDPEFIWNHTVGVTGLKFLNSDKLGKEYKNDMFVADTNGERIYHFELDQSRTALHLQGPLIDRIAESDDELANVVFAKDFGSRITDLEIGPDGYLYVVLIDAGKIYRIIPTKETAPPQ